MPWALAAQLSSSCPGRSDGTAEFLSFWELEFSHFPQLPLTVYFYLQSHAEVWVLSLSGRMEHLDWTRNLLNRSARLSKAQSRCHQNRPVQVSPKPAAKSQWLRTLSLSCPLACPAREPGPFSDCVLPGVAQESLVFAELLCRILCRIILCRMLFSGNKSLPEDKCLERVLEWILHRHSQQRQHSAWKRCL